VAAIANNTSMAGITSAQLKLSLANVKQIFLLDVKYVSRNIYNPAYPKIAINILYNNPFIIRIYKK
jgi:hypothetical protein